MSDAPNSTRLHSNEIDKLAVAMCGVQAEIGPATQGSVNPFYKSKYADLGEVWSACRDALAKHQVAIIQSAEVYEGKNYLATILLHSSGQWIKGLFELCPGPKADAQSLGSAITYMRRYSLAAMVGVVSDDDDGNAASGRKAKTATKKVAPQPSKPSDNGNIHTAAQADFLNKLMKSSVFSEDERSANEDFLSQGPPKDKVSSTIKEIQALIIKREAAKTGAR